MNKRSRRPKAMCDSSASGLAIRQPILSLSLPVRIGIRCPHSKTALPIRAPIIRVLCCFVRIEKDDSDFGPILSRYMRNFSVIKYYCNGCYPAGHVENHLT